MKDNLLKLFNTKDLINQTSAGVEVANWSASYNELIELLKSDDSNLVNAALLKLNHLENKEDSFLFISKLVGNETKIREIASFRLLDFIQQENFSDFFQKKEVLSILLKGVDDVNPTICRNVIASLAFIKNKNLIIENIIKKINILSLEISKIEDIKNHENNKKIFNLYWNLQALCFLTSNFIEEINSFKEEIVGVIEQNKKSLNYQIREKSALICFNLLSTFKDKQLLELQEQFSQDENFYVRKIFTI